MEGYQILTCPINQTENLLHQIQTELPDLILMDVHLNGKNGIDLLHQIKADPQVPMVKIIMSSGMDLKAECIAAGADDFLMKPYMPEDLFRIIDQHLAP